MCAKRYYKCYFIKLYSSLIKKCFQRIVNNTFPRKFVGGPNRRIVPSWFDIYNWLECSVNLGAAFSVLFDTYSTIVKFLALLRCTIPPYTTI
jgi:hypothetical protein